jgi:hypothetical protein
VALDAAPDKYPVVRRLAATTRVERGPIQDDALIRIAFQNGA